MPPVFFLRRGCLRTSSELRESFEGGIRQKKGGDRIGNSRIGELLGPILAFFC